MHNLKELRKNLNDFIKSIQKRTKDIDFDNLIKLDETNRNLIKKKESLEKEKKDISKLKDERLFDKSKEISKELDEVIKKQKKTNNELNLILSNIPNLPCEGVPLGKDENDNVEISKSGKIPKFDFKPKTHYEIGESLNVLYAPFSLANSHEASSAPKYIVSNTNLFISLASSDSYPIPSLK